MEQTRSLFCMCNSGVARCQSPHQCHIWRMNSILEANCTGKVEALQLSVKVCVVHEAMDGLQNSKNSLRACFENVNIHICTLDCLKSYTKLGRKQFSSAGPTKMQCTEFYEFNV